MRPTRFCQYLYAKVNGQRAPAARYWKRPLGTVEYELPMALLQPVKDLKGRKSREHAVEKVMLIIRSEMALYRKHTEEEYVTHGPHKG